jgi:hypothetical protein
MTFMIKVNTFMGRPPGRIQDRPFQMRLSGEFLERLDVWRHGQLDPPSRAEAIRRLTTAMLLILEHERGEKVGDQMVRRALQDAGIVSTDEDERPPNTRPRRLRPTK